MDPAWCLVMVDDPWLWTPGKTSGFDVPGNVRPLATRETPGDETPGDEIPGDVRPLATRETPGDVVRRSFNGPSNPDHCDMGQLGRSGWTLASGKWILDGTTATTTLEIFECNLDLGSN